MNIGLLSAAILALILSSMSVYQADNDYTDFVFVVAVLVLIAALSLPFIAKFYEIGIGIPTHAILSFVTVLSTLTLAQGTDVGDAIRTLGGAGILGSIGVGFYSLV